MPLTHERFAKAASSIRLLRLLAAFLHSQGHSLPSQLERHIAEDTRKAILDEEVEQARITPLLR